jgi:hypothetical protein
MTETKLAIKDTLILLSTFAMCIAPLFPTVLDGIGV